MAKEMIHSFTVSGYIEMGSPHMAWSISHVKGKSIEAVILTTRNMFNMPVMVSDVKRIISYEEKEQNTDETILL